MPLIQSSARFPVSYHFEVMNNWQPPHCPLFPTFVTLSRNAPSEARRALLYAGAQQSLRGGYVFDTVKTESEIEAILKAKPKRVQRKRARRRSK